MAGKGGAGPRRKGDVYERDTCKYLNTLGYFARRAPRSAFPDIFAANGLTGDVLFVECKLAGRLRKEERAELLRLAVEYGATPILASHRPIRLRVLTMKGEYEFTG